MGSTRLTVRESDCFQAGFLRPPFHCRQEDRIQKYHSMEFHRERGSTAPFQWKTVKRLLPADFVIVAVKYNALPEALNTMKNCVGPDTTIISVMNGISSEQIIGERYGREKVLLHRPGHGRHEIRVFLTYTQAGELRVGALSPRTEQPSGSHDRLLSTGLISYTVEDDILHRLWGKFHAECRCKPDLYGVWDHLFRHTGSRRSP